MGIDIQYASRSTDLPNEKQLRSYINTALLSETIKNSITEPELTLRIVDEHEGRLLNQKWRQATAATNVISFANHQRYPQEPDDGIGLLGDIVICAPVVRREARIQNKDLDAHWAHLVIHGVLHLQGLDHQTPEQAERMESLETELLAGLNYRDPYT